MRFVKGVWWYYSVAETVCSQTSAAKISMLMEPKQVNYITVNQMEVRRCVIDSACFLLCFFNAPFQDGRLFQKVKSTMRILCKYLSLSSDSSGMFRETSRLLFN